MSGRRKGIDAEREAVRLLRAEGLRVLRIARDRDAPEGLDVDAVILPDGGGDAVCVQIKREERPAGAWFHFIGPGRVLMCRRNGEDWAVWVRGALDDPPMALDLFKFARWFRQGLV